MQLHGHGMPSSEYLTFCDALQAAWVHFAETGSHALLCMLQPTLLTIYSLGGELHSMPLACKFTQIWPLPRGLILAVGQAPWPSVVACSFKVNLLPRVYPAFHRLGVVSCANADHVQGTLRVYPACRMASCKIGAVHVHADRVLHYQHLS